MKLAPIVLLFCCVFAAGADHNWGYIYQGASSSSINSLSNVPDGGLVFIKGGTLVRTGRSGNILWQRSASDGVYFSKTAVTGDGKIVVAAYATGDQSDVALLCFDSKGDLLWQKSYKLPERQFPLQIVPLPSGWIVAASEIENAFPSLRNLVLYRLAENGAVIWNKRYPAFNPSSVARTPDGGAVVVGRPNISLLKLSKDGMVEWATQFTRHYDFPQLVQPLQDGYLVLSVKYYPVAGSDARGEIALTKLSLAGQLVWQKFLKGRKSLNPSDLQLIPDGMVIGGARTAAHHWDMDAFLLETDRSGNLRKTITFGDGNHQSVTQIKRSGAGFLTVAVAEDLMPAPGERDWILQFPENELLPFPCASIEASADPITSYTTSPPGIRTLTQAAVSLDPIILNRTSPLSKGDITRSNFCSSHVGRPSLHEANN